MLIRILIILLIAGVISTSRASETRLVFSTIEGSPDTVACGHVLEEAYGRLGIDIRVQVGDKDQPRQRLPPFPSFARRPPTLSSKHGKTDRSRVSRTVQHEYPGGHTRSKHEHAWSLQQSLSSS